MMTGMIVPAPVRRSVTVEVPVERAFQVFTANFGRWWPAAYSIGATALKTAVIEPRVGGRWYEIGDDGQECLWGEVLAWEPPSRILLAWRIRADWQFDPDLLTEVEVNFVPLGTGATRVDLEHRLLENMGSSEAVARGIYESDGGWSGILAGYVAATAVE